MAVHPDPHDPVITTDADENYVKTTCRNCGAQLDEAGQAVVGDLSAVVLAPGATLQITEQDGRRILSVELAEEVPPEPEFQPALPISNENVPPGPHDDPLNPEAEETDAAEEGLEPSDGEPEYPDGNSGGEAAEAGSGDSPVDSPKRLTKRQKAAAKAEAVTAANAAEWDAYVASEEVND